MPPGTLPLTPIPQYIPQTPGFAGLASKRVEAVGYSMEALAARDRRMRRLVWILVVLFGIGVGFIVATQI